MATEHEELDRQVDVLKFSLISGTIRALGGER